jgi:lactoylglutathione lyase
MSLSMLIYSDGGARGNPGPAAVAFIALNEKSETIKTDTSFIGVRTNNQAEYEALIFALTFASGQKAKEVTCHLDSELVVKQLNGEYTVKNPELQQLWRKIRDLKKEFEKITFISVPREHQQIQRADSLLNQTLDAQESSSVTNKNLKNGSVFVHASIRTSNMERSIAFYSQLLGLRLLSRQEIKKTNAEIAFLQDLKGNGCVLELTLYRDQKKFNQSKYEERLFDHLGFEVDDIQMTLAMLRKEHLTITDEPFALNEHTTIAFLEDPDGTLIELIERK